MLHTVGYEGRNIVSFVSLLIEHDVDELVDVRLNAISRKPGFSKTRLSAALADAGIGYRHIRELGNPASNREAFRAGKASAVKRYRAQLDNGARHAVEEVATIASVRSVVLLCYERDHEACHRRIVADVAREIDSTLVIAPIE